LRETTERERVRKNFIRVVVKTERRFRDERTHRIREDDDEDQRDALKSFVRSETSADREARATFILLNERTTTRTTKREKKGDIREKSAGF